MNRKKAPRVSIGSIRRREIVDAAWAIIAEQGLQNLSLSEIEKKIGMSRGQLTYYFKSKEDILLAVFDRLMEQCKERGRPGDGDPKHPLGQAGWEETIEWILRKVLVDPEDRPEFHALHYTFLSQISHRRDFRQRLARLYEEGRQKMIEHMEASMPHRPRRKFSPHAFATVVQALINGLAVQAAVDPRSLAGEEIVQMGMQMLRSYLWPGTKPASTRRGISTQARNGKAQAKVKSRGKS